MYKWLCVLLLTLTQVAQAAPGAIEPQAPVSTEKNLLVKLDSVRHGVVDRTSDLVITAMGFLGVPYRRGGNSAETGFDCSGLVRTIYGQTIGLMLPRRADQQAAATQSIDKKELQPGDLVFFNTMRRAFSHVGIYVVMANSSTRPAAAPKCAWKACKPPTGHAALTAPAASQKMAQMPHHPNHKFCLLALVQ